MSARRRDPAETASAASASVEDYVKAIHAHTEWHPAPITTTALAARLGVTSASASEMVRRLDERGLVVHRPYRPVELTEAGRVLAVAMIRRHRLLETWLATELAYGWDEVHDEAERLEHAVSDRFIEAIAERLGDPDRDPHGDPIPRRDGTVPVVEATPLADFDVDHPVRVRRVSDADPALLRQLADLGIGPDSALTLLADGPVGAGTGAGDAGGMRVRKDLGLKDAHADPAARKLAGRTDVRLTPAAVAAVWVVSRGEHPGCTLSPRPGHPAAERRRPVSAAD
ncbi:metal-dependent transcriptional regulator [Tersicoccus sp. MR15.9]|uniref:metal-dependent transcriptional regulator n=1 Tax=Tersicoccus mangrovi TaxID=3121635 RepID=UPI002FE6842E